MEIWFAALTGLREASELGHQHTMQGDDGVTQPADITINANRLLWRSMVLVKVCGGDSMPYDMITNNMPGAFYHRAIVYKEAKPVSTLLILET